MYSTRCANDMHKRKRHVQWPEHLVRRGWGGASSWVHLTPPWTRTPLTPSSIVAVQGLGAHPYYTWVKKTPTSNSNKTKRLRDKVQIWKNKKSQDGGVDSGSDGVVDDVVECMWLRDLLVPLFKNARIATYSYKSDWRDREVKTSLRECAEQFLNILS